MAIVFTITEKLLDKVFPFALIFNRSMVILHAGKSMIKLFPDITGNDLFDFFEIMRPGRAGKTFAEILQFSGQIFILKAKNPEKPILFRFDLIEIKEDHVLSFIGSPWVTEANELKSIGLNLKDFALHDSITDLLQIMSFKEITTKEVKDLNEKLEKSEYKYRHIVEFAHDMIYYLDPRGNFTYVNPVIVEKLNKKKQDIIGKHFSELVQESYKKEVIQFYREQIREKKKRTYMEFPIVVKNNETIWIGQNVSATFDDQNEITSFIAVARDITQRKFIEENLRYTELRLRNLISNLQAGILVEDENRHIVLTNQFFCDLFKIPVPPDKMIGIDCSQAAEQSKGLFTNPENFVKIIEKRLEDRTVAVGDELHTVEGRYLERDYIPIYFEDKYLGHLWQYRDLTEKKKNQEYLIVARKQAEEAQQAEKQFLAKMSHEIRTPLNAILGMSHLLNETKISQEQEEYLDILQSSANILQNLITDILDLSKVTAGQIEVIEAPFDLLKLVKSLYKSFSHKFSEKRVDFILKFDDNIKREIIGDELLLNQILLNLLANASKFTDKGSVIFEVLLKKEMTDSYDITFIVSDTGIGISENDQDKIFENFIQADKNISRKYGGTGLGLAIVKQLVEILDGKITLQSKFEKGSTFTIDLSFKTNNHQVRAQLSKEIQKSSSIEDLKILIAEDNIMNQKYITRLMKKWNIAFDLAKDGREAWDSAKTNKYDLILMDIQMPEYDGYEVSEMIRHENNLNKETWIIALTASALKEHKLEAEKAGMNDYLSKPFKPDQLMSKLESFIALKNQA